MGRKRYANQGITPAGKNDNLFSALSSNHPARPILLAGIFAVLFTVLLTLLLTLLLAPPSLAQASAPEKSDPTAGDDCEEEVEIPGYAEDENLYTVAVDLPAEVVNNLTVAALISEGQVYGSDSLRITGAATAPNVTVSSNNDGTRPILVEWNFGKVDNSADLDIRLEFRLTVADVVDNRDGVVLDSNLVSIRWEDEGGVAHEREKGSEPVTIVEPELTIEGDPTTPAGEGETNHIIAVYHTPESHADAFDVNISLTMPPETACLPGSVKIVTGPPGVADDSDPSNPMWRFDAVDRSWNEGGGVLLGFNTTGDQVPGSINASVEWWSAPKDYPDARRYLGRPGGLSTLAATRAVPQINLTKTADKKVVEAGDSVNYSYLVENYGETDITINNLTDDKIEEIYPDPGGVIIRAKENATFTASYPVTRFASDPIVNNATIEALDLLGKRLTANATASVNLSLSTLSVEALPARGFLWINKTADKNTTLPGQRVNYTIRYGNSFATTARDAVVFDILPDVEYLSSRPSPDSSDGRRLRWSLGDLSPGAAGTINVTVKVPDRPTIAFYETSSVRGEGYANLWMRLSTEREGYPLTNYANITARLSGDVVANSSRAVVVVAEVIGTVIGAAAHGSGCYEEEELLSLNTSTRKVTLDDNLSAKEGPAILALPNKRTLTLHSPWADRVYAKNYVRGEEISENHLYMDVLEKDRSILLDENQTVYSSEGELSGLARFGYAKRVANTTSETMEFNEDYHGSFKVNRSIDSYGAGTKYVKSSQGEGFASSDARVGEDQRSFEHGTGLYVSEEFLDQGVIYKDLDMVYVPGDQRAGGHAVNYTNRWEEGMYARDRKLGSVIVERTGSADLAKMEALMGPSSLSVYADINGSESLKAAVQREPHGEEVILVDQVFEGRYRLDTTISVHVPPKYVYPHLNVTKEALKLDDETALFRINVTNDGNKSLTLVKVVDTLPEGMTFINSSLRPEIEGQNVSWTLIYLGIGRSRSIDLRVRLDDTSSETVNRVKATGRYDGENVTAEDSCSFVLDWLLCCPAGVEDEEEKEEVKEDRSNFPESGGWVPGQCMGITSNESDCYEYIEDYLEGDDECPACVLAPGV